MGASCSGDCSYGGNWTYVGDISGAPGAGGGCPWTGCLDSRGGTGGQGGSSVTGHDGASGSSGGLGGGGAGGTVKLAGSVVEGNETLRADLRGGSGGTQGEDGRLAFGSNVRGGPVGTVYGRVGSHIGLEQTGLGNLNPYIKPGDVATPFIPGLQGGAELYGLLAGIDAQVIDFQPLRDQAPANALAALYRMDVGPAGYADDFLGFDMLLFLNLTGQALLNPVLGIDPANLDTSFANALLTGGYLTDSQFGGTGPQLLSVLEGHQIWATLIPEGGTVFNASADGLVDGIYGVHLANGEFAYVNAVPEPGEYLLLGIGLVVVIARRAMRRRE